jgi:hypothetical protein
MKKWVICLVCILITAPIFANSVTKIDSTGMDLLKGAKLIIRASEGAELSTDDAILGSYFNGYMAAFNDVYAVKTAANESYCLPEQGITSEQIAYVAKNFLEKRPEKLHFPSGLLLFKALVEFYPCK